MTRHSLPVSATIRRLVVAEDGAGTTLAYLMVIPIYLVTFVVILETCFMLLAVLGTTHAAFAAARVGIVRRADDVNAEAVRQAAVEAFVPFASSMVAGDGGASADRDAFVAAFAEEAARRGGLAGNAGFIARQHDDASAGLLVTATTDVVGEPWEEDLTVTVSYAYPFAIPLVGRMFDALSPGGVFELHGKAVLPMEHPENPERKLGISYGTP